MGTALLNRKILLNDKSCLTLEKSIYINNTYKKNYSLQKISCCIFDNWIYFVGGGAGKYYYRTHNVYEKIYRYSKNVYRINYNDFIYNTPQILKIGSKNQACLKISSNIVAFGFGTGNTENHFINGIDLYSSSTNGQLSYVKTLFEDMNIINPTIATINVNNYYYTFIGNFEKTNIIHGIRIYNNDITTIKNTLPTFYKFLYMKSIDISNEVYALVNINYKYFHLFLNKDGYEDVIEINNLTRIYLKRVVLLDNYIITIDIVNGSYTFVYCQNFEQNFHIFDSSISFEYAKHFSCVSGENFAVFYGNNANVFYVFYIENNVLKMKKYFSDMNSQYLSGVILNNHLICMEGDGTSLNINPYRISKYLFNPN